ncbi:hypothetical protein ACH41E_30230 [Streptomyces sp. NPDC020412]|uniref:hypothetical protein n=1 Tax=Streptomyces sp. NPDC020412 TaxID=3365073 RepID=UPI0037888312
MKFPVDDTTLEAWASLLGLTEQQTADALNDIERVLRAGYAHRPDELRDTTFEQLTADMDAEEAALLFLISGLRQAGHRNAAYEIEAGSIFTPLLDHNQAN